MRREEQLEEAITKASQAADMLANDILEARGIAMSDPSLRGAAVGIALKRADKLAAKVVDLLATLAAAPLILAMLAILSCSGCAWGRAALSVSHVMENGTTVMYTWTTEPDHASLRR